MVLIIYPMPCFFSSVLIKTKVKSKTFSSVKPDASAQNVYEVAEALMELQEYSTIEIAKIDNTTLA